jgi:hypothetical protein
LPTTAWATAPETGLGSGSGGAERLGAGAAADGADLVAVAATRPPPSACLAPRFTGCLVDRAGRCTCADGAGQHGFGAAGGADRPVRGADAHGRRRSQSRQISWLAGSVIRQSGDTAVRRVRRAWRLPG